MQSKVDKLIELFDNFQSERQKNYAIKLLSGLVDVINNQSDDIDKLISRKFNILPGEVDTELDKYILVLGIYDYCQSDFRLVNYETLKFLFDNRLQLTKKPSVENIIRIQNIIMQFEFEYDRKPNDINELKEYIAKCS
jgi:hypothetical protein